MQQETIWVRDIMVTSLTTVSSSDYVLDVIDRLLQAQVSGAPVVDEQYAYQGVLSEMSCLEAFSVIQEQSDKQNAGASNIHARDFMNRRIVTLSPRMDAVAAIEYLLKHRISGAPVVDEHGRYLGVFSESSALKFVISSSYDQLPSSDVSAFMNRGRGRVVTEDTTLEEVRSLFRDDSYRRLPVLNGDIVVGQISRRDALRAEWDRLVTQLKEIKRLSETSGFQVSDFMDRSAKTTESNTDLISAAHVFFNSSARRLPVLDNGALVGQVSRRDVIRAASKLFEPASDDGPSALYLSSISSDAAMRV